MIPAMVVPLLTRPELLNRLIGSIDYPVADLVVIDNGHCVRSLPWSPHVEQMHLVTMPSNLGVSGSWNLGVKSLPFVPWWLIVNFDAYFPAGSLERFHVEARQDELVLSQAAPPWACFALGSSVVETVGLFDERLHPAYFEDNDYERRCTFHGFAVRQSGIPVGHDNSSTLNAGYQGRNNETFFSNRQFYDAKVRGADMTPGWALSRRRELTWD